MKMISAILISLTAFSAFAQEYYGFNRRTGEIYPSKVFVASCPRSVYPECPRKSVDFYEDLVELMNNNTLEISINSVSTLVGGDSDLIKAASQAIAAVDSQANRRKQLLSKSELVALALKDDRVNATRTFNAIVRLISGLDLLNKK